MTPSQNSAIESAKKNNPSCVKMEIKGEDNKGNIIVEYTAPAYIQAVKIGKRGSHTWGYKYANI